MLRKRFTTVAATGVLTLGLVFGTSTSADAAVTARDLPSKSDIVKKFPDLKGGTFEPTRTKLAGVPAKKCGATTTVKVKSGRTLTGTSTRRISALAGVFQFKSKSSAKKAMKKYKRYVRRCSSFTYNGVKVKLSKTRTPKLGQDRLGMSSVSTIVGTKAYSSSVIIRHGKRIASVAVADDAKVSRKRLNKLAKVAAKKMR